MEEETSRITSHLRWAVAVALAAISCSLPLGAQTKPRIVIVATGGTIAGAAESTTAAGYKSGAVAVLINAVPQMKKFVALWGTVIVALL